MRKLLLATAAAFAMNVAVAAPPTTVTLDVRNMDCELCPITVKKSLERVAGVTAVDVDFTHRIARVTFDPEKADTGALVQATTNAGYPSVVRQP